MTRTATWRQGALLLVCSTLPVLGAVLLGPVLPDIQREFAATPGVAVKAPVMMAIPALVIAVFAPFAGIMTDRLGRRLPLLIGLALYGVVGTLPMWLGSLDAIIASRALLGVTEAVIMTSATTLIGDCFDGPARCKWLALQGAAASLAAMIFFGLGGALGELGWRAPFLMYASSFVLLPLAAWLLWEPLVTGHRHQTLRLPWRVLGAAYPFAVVTGAALLVMPIQAGFVLNLLGITAPSAIGAVAAATQGAVFVGSFLFRPLMRFGFAGTFAAGFGCAGAGLVMVSAATSQQGVLIGGSINGLGCGLLLVGLINWAMALLPIESRGRGTGGFTASVFLGEFLSPLAILAIGGTAGLMGAIGLFGWFLLAMVVPAVLAPLWAARTVLIPSHST